MNLCTSDGEMAMTARGSVLVGASGEAYVLYQLYRRDLLAAPASSGAPIADLIVVDPKMSVGSMIQVKTSTRPNSWVLTTKNTRPENVHPRFFYALVHLAPPSPTVFIVPSKVIAEVLTVSCEAWQTTLDRHGRPHGDSAIHGLMRRYPFDVPGYPAGWLDPYLDRWDYLTAEPETIAGLLA